jgi:hypothetical protein
MLDVKRERIEAATRKAADRFARAAEREVRFLSERQKARDLDAAKTTRLRALRLAKEATDREAQAKIAAEKHAASEARRAYKKRKPALPVGSVEPEPVEGS